MSQDRPLLGILLMLGFCLLAPLSDALAKLLGDQIALSLLVMLRFVAQVVILLPIVLLSGRSLRLPSHTLWLTLIRTLLHIGGISFMFLALRYLPLADAVAIAYVMPFVLLLLGRVFLKEEVGPRRLIACIIGFIGTLLVVQPNLMSVGAPALLPVAVAVIFALFMLVTRQIAQGADPIVLQAVSGIVATVVMTPVLLLGLATGLPAVTPVPTNITPIILMILFGALGTVTHLLMTWSLRFAPSATLAPMQYLEIPFATLFGWLIFRDFPNALALIGIIVTVAAGLYIVLRERRLSRTPGPSPAPPAAATRAAK